MTNPHEVLGVSANAEETVIRDRYLELVRRHPPEREPERFAEIQEAYNLLRDPVTRMERELFAPCSEGSLDGLAKVVLARVRAARLPTPTLLSLAELP